MRDILFRGKRDDGAWVIGSLVEMTGVINKGRTYIMPQGEGLSFEHFGEHGTCSIGSFVEVDPATVGQYTGMKDKTDCEIYEGDIISTPEYGVDSGQGVNFSGSDKFIVKYADGSFFLENRLRQFILRPDKKGEIIGNIYDNPKLIGGAE